MTILVLPAALCPYCNPEAETPAATARRIFSSDAVPHLGRAKSVVHEHGDGHRTNAAWHGRDQRGLRRDRVERHVSHNVVSLFDRLVLDAIDADIDDDGAITYHVGLHKVRCSDRRDQNIGRPTDLREVPTPGVAYRNRGVRPRVLL